MKHGNPERTITPGNTTGAGARSFVLPALLCAGIALGACTSMGTGSGSVSTSNAPVTFAWKSTDGGNTGTMTATVAGKQTFSGPYLQITKEVRTDDFGPIWAGWGYGWNDWDGFGPYWGPEFATEYSGRVIANLQASDGQRMRCRFQLNSPLDGMTGGGQGDCQLDNGRSVNAVFSRGTTKLGTI